MWGFLLSNIPYVLMFNKGLDYNFKAPLFSFKCFNTKHQLIVIVFIFYNAFFLDSFLEIWCQKTWFCQALHRYVLLLTPSRQSDIHGYLLIMLIILIYTVFFSLVQDPEVLVNIESDNNNSTSDTVNDLWNYRYDFCWKVDLNEFLIFYFRKRRKYV